MPKTPLFIMEEHHEAFFIWHYAIHQQLMVASGNTLLHVDEHADIGAPRLFQSVDTLGMDLHAIYRFTFDELSCFEFIIPSLYLGLFKELVWIRQTAERKSDQIAIVRAPQKSGQFFEIAAYNVFSNQPTLPPKAPTDGRCVRYRHQTTTDVLPAMDKVILDIDLDYFSCEDAVNLPQKLEVSPEEYVRFQTDRYHFLRINQGSRIKMQEEDGRYFLYLKNYPEAAPTPLRVSKSAILERLDAFVAFLRDKQVKPQIIDIARSRFSGYTPHDQWQFIEQNLIERLSTLYDLDIRTVDQVYESLPRQLEVGQEDTP
jgi:hypothetical protein